MFMKVDRGNFISLLKEELKRFGLPDENKDDTHLCVYGAVKVAELVAVRCFKEQHLRLAKYLK
jgi:hypothetical protein